MEGGVIVIPNYERNTPLFGVFEGHLTSIIFKLYKSKVIIL